MAAEALGKLGARTKDVMETLWTALKKYPNGFVKYWQ
jgi:hypothetical protein